MYKDAHNLEIVPNQRTLFLAREEGHEGHCIQCLIRQLSARELSKGGDEVQLTGKRERDLERIWKWYIKGIGVGNRCANYVGQNACGDKEFVALHFRNGNVTGTIIGSGNRMNHNAQ